MTVPADETALRLRRDGVVRLTVATATKNAVTSGRAESLERCIRSVAALPFPHEHLVRDGGSQDGSQDVLGRLAQEVSGLNVVSAPDGGLYEALNGALEAARGEWILVLGDDDEIIDASVLAVMLDSAVARRSEVLVASVSIGGDRLITARPWFVLGGMSCPHQGMLVRTSALRGIGGFDTRYRIAADYDSFLRLALRGARVSRFDRPFARFAFGTGLSRVENECEDEVAASLAAVLGLSDSERDFRRRNRVLPFHSSVRFLWHRSPFVRSAACWQVAKRMAQLIGIGAPK